MNYCEFAASLPENTDNPNKHYHDTQYGFPIEDDNELFERLDKAEWVKLFKKHFKFVGSEIVGEFLMSTGYLKGAHAESCPVYRKTLKYHPKWLDAV